jgi:hypothetical protein
MSTTSADVVKKGSGASSISPGTWIVIAGALAVLVGSFLPWVKAITSTGSVTLNGISTDGKFTLIFSAVGLIAGVLAVYSDRIGWLFATGMVLLVSAVFSGLDLATLPHPVAVFTSLNWQVGIWLCFVGSLIGFLASIAAVQTYLGRTSS